MATTIVHYSPAQNITVKAQTPVKAGTFVQIAATLDGRNPVVKTAAAKSRAFGVPATDAAKDAHVMIYRSGHIVDVASTGSITAGSPVAVGANGKAAQAGEADPVVGVAVSTAASDVVTVALA